LIVSNPMANHLSSPLCSFLLYFLQIFGFYFGPLDDKR
jgi:hypothetical protein